MLRVAFASIAFLLISSNTVLAQEPTLPEGLGTSLAHKSKSDVEDEPGLPVGLQSDEPALPFGLTMADEPSTSVQKGQGNPALPSITGFLEGRVGPRLRGDTNEGMFTIGEARLRLETQLEIDDVVVSLVGDGVFDEVIDDRIPDLETGKGAFDLREANFVWRALPFADVKAGRQILTWGVGDLVFINDLFPKDFQSFFIGRDDEYLKAPSDAVRVSFFNSVVNVDVVYTPKFDADRFIDGSRLSYFNPMAGEIVGQNFVLDPEKPDQWFTDDEISARAYRQIGSFEFAAYGYVGFFKSPNGVSAVGDFTFPELTVFGASLRGPLRGGIVTAEFGRYISRNDLSGDNALIPNSDMRFLVGYEKEIASDLTASVQYYAQVRSDHDVFLENLPMMVNRPDRTRHLLTLRLTKLAVNHNLTLSLFNFWSPNEDDGHLRLRASYKLDDNWLIEGGGNFFYGPNKQVFFSQMKDNTNLFFAARRSF